MTKVGDKTVLLADSVEGQGQTQQIDRSPRTFSGTVLDTHTAKMNGREALFAIVDTQRFGKIAVDFGPAGQTQNQVKKGQSVTFCGVPVKVKGKRALLAQRVKSDNGDWMDVPRRSAQESQSLVSDQSSNSTKTKDKDWNQASGQNQGGSPR